jgi:hypothetical protein
MLVAKPTVYYYTMFLQNMEPFLFSPIHYTVKYLYWRSLMSDLAATNCGCNSDNGCSNLIWIILLLSCCCGNGTSLFNGNGGCGGDNSSCWIIILLLLCCNNGGGCC